MPPPGTKSVPKTPAIRVKVTRQRVVSILRALRSNHGEMTYRAAVAGILDDLAADERARAEGAAA